MTGLRQKMTQDLQLRGLSERTQQAYLRAARKLAEFYRHSREWMTLINIRIETQKTLPDVLAPEQVRELWPPSRRRTRRDHSQATTIAAAESSASWQQGQHSINNSRPLNRVLSSHSKTSAPAVCARPAFRLNSKFTFQSASHRRAKNRCQADLRSTPRLHHGAESHHQPPTASPRSNRFPKEQARLAIRRDS